MLSKLRNMLRRKVGVGLAVVALAAPLTAVATGAVAPSAAPVVAPVKAEAYAYNVTMCWKSSAGKYQITFSNYLAPASLHLLVSNGSYGSWWLPDSWAQNPSTYTFNDPNWVNGIWSYGAPGVSTIWRASSYTGWC